PSPKGKASEAAAPKETKEAGLVAPGTADAEPEITSRPSETRVPREIPLQPTATPQRPSLACSGTNEFIYTAIRRPIRCARARDNADILVFGRGQRMATKQEFPVTEKCH